MSNHEILGPALQKYYSALKSLYDFGQHGDFFDDVSNLDLPDFDFGEGDESTSVLKAALPGTVIAVNVTVGQSVAKGQTLLVLESMKMENAVTAPSDGVVEDIAVSVGSYVTKDQALVALKAVEA